MKAEYEQSGRRDLLADAMLDDHGKPRDHWQRVTANLTPVVAQEVFDYLRPDGHQGLFGTMLGDAG